MSKEWMLILVMAAMTALLRFLPFLLLRFTAETPEVIVHLGNVLPQAAIGMLVVYCLRNATPAEPAVFTATIAAGILSAVLQWRTKNIVWTVIGGTAVYMVLLHV